MVTAARTVIVTAERIVDGAMFEAQPELTSIAGFMVTHVVHCPAGARPTSCHGMYGIDLSYLADFYAHTQTSESFNAWLHESVLTCSPRMS